ncbi:hypothetical protein L1987_68954 [Smallanthus sonchifolius]|uniref:Uncharacterized protein n=1 Tax=Smallanthus sonchifolius TaxID=185202 RepID=A0ACB9B4D1_9ASTR|nr:hypothetical protein L1987_88076 [Smallanthus sonchifolius]KAI3717374.1 hypothetical protein L1987_68954 [Smallanthus sonchifolius]
MIKGVEIIHITDCSSFKDVFTPASTNFDLGALREYVTSDTSFDQSDVILEGETSEMNEYTPNMTYPSYLLHTCHHLQHLELHKDGRVKEVVFEMDSQRPLLLPYLQVLELHGLKDMSHVWKCNWNNFLIPQHHPLQFPFQNLTNISLEHCHNIKYLFSPLMAKFLSNLKDVYVEECDGIEEVVSSRDDENKETTPSTSSHQHTTLFPCLDILTLHILSGLKRIDGADQSQLSAQAVGACWSLCQCPRRIYIEMCDALSSLIPWYAPQQMKRLEELKVQWCTR